MSSEEQQSIYSHHNRRQLCTNRPKYRASKRLTAVKVYTVANESRYLLVFGVPKINLQNEVRREFQKFGTVESVENVTVEQLRKGIDIERFTDCFKVIFEKLDHARRSNKFTDDKNFYGGILHVSYAPEYETNDDIRQKFNQRRQEVEHRINVNKKSEKKTYNLKIFFYPMIYRADDVRAINTNSVRTFPFLVDAPVLAFVSNVIVMVISGHATQSILFDDYFLMVASKSLGLYLQIKNNSNFRRDLCMIFFDATITQIRLLNYKK